MRPLAIKKWMEGSVCLFLPAGEITLGGSDLRKGLLEIIQRVRDVECVWPITDGKSVCQKNGQATLVVYDIC